MAAGDTEDSAVAAQGRWFVVGLDYTHSRQGRETHSAVAAGEKGVEQTPKGGSGMDRRSVRTGSEVVRGPEKLIVRPWFEIFPAEELIQIYSRKLHLSGTTMRGHSCWAEYFALAERHNLPFSSTP